jgi:hypothetical protein
MLEAYEKSGKLVCHVVSSKNAINSLPILQISMGIVAIFERTFFSVFSNIGEDLHHRCFNQWYYERCVSEPDINAVLGNDYCLQIIETCFAEQF